MSHIQDLSAFWAEIKTKIDEHRTFIDKEMAEGRFPERKPYLRDGSEVFVVKVLFAEHSIFVLSESDEIKRLVVDETTVALYKKHVPLDPAIPDGRTGFAFATMHGDTVRIEIGFMEAIGTPTLFDYVRNLRLLVGPQHNPKPVRPETLQ